MDENAELLDDLAASGLRVLGLARRANGEEWGYFIYVAVTRDRDNKQDPSKRKLLEIKNQLADKGVQVDFLLRDERASDVEAGLRASLLHSYDSYVRNVYASIDGGAVNVWIEPERDIEEVFKSLEGSVATFLSSLDLVVGHVTLTADENLPSIFACLKTLRTIAPASLPELRDRLIDKSFAVPSIDWLKRRLESMRKKGLVVWLEGNRYALTLSSLQRLGTVKGRSSPDVERMLAMARRRG